MPSRPKKKTAKVNTAVERFRSWLSGRTPAERTFWSRAKRAVLFGVPAGFLLLVLLFGVAYAVVRVPKPSDLATAHSTLILDRNGKTIARVHAEADRVDIPSSSIPGVMRQAVIAAEDHRFYTHSGVSLPSIVRAGIANLFGGGVRQGGSTITQQYVKNAYVGSERTIWRKIKEAIVAIKIERKESKEQILTDYLNTIYFGRGAYGIESASQTYFSTSARSLKVDQAALLAGLIRAPELNDPVRHADRAKIRRDTVLDQMAELNFIPREEAAAAKRKPVKVRAGVAKSAAVSGAHFIEDVRRILVNQYGASRVYRGGMTVRTTLDLRLQKFAEQAVAEVLDKPSDPEAALVSVDTATGEVLAMVGGRSFSEREFNLASQGRRQPGSAFKPFVLAAALDQNISLKSSFKAPASITLKTGFEPWKVTNYDRKDYGTLDLLGATEFSVNTVFAQLILKVGPGHAADSAREAGITSTISPVPSLTLGTSSVSPMEMAGAYAGFARDGMRATPHLIRSIAESGHEIFKSEVKPEQGLSSDTANTIAYALTQVVQKGTGRRAQLGDRPVGGKTGTTENHVDAWFAGFTRQISTVVWMGFPEGSKKTMEHVRGIAVTGGSFPARIWKAYMEKAVEGTPVEPFGKPIFTGETLSPSPSPSPTPSPSSTVPTVLPSLTPSNSPEPSPSSTKDNKPSPSPSPTGGATGG
jgi:penicillin-binding protein 1A